MEAVFVGTVLWLIVGLAVGWKVLKHIAMQSPPGKQWQNQKIGLVALIMAGVSMWMMWATCYMHQMYPLIRPKMEE